MPLEHVRNAVAEAIIIHIANSITIMHATNEKKGNSKKKSRVARSLFCGTVLLTTYSSASVFVYANVTLEKRLFRAVLIIHHSSSVYGCHVCFMRVGLKIKKFI